MPTDTAPPRPPSFAPPRSPEENAIKLGKPRELDVDRAEYQIEEALINKVRLFVDKYPDQTLAILRRWMNENRY